MAKIRISIAQTFFVDLPDFQDSYYCLTGMRTAQRICSSFAFLHEFDASLVNLPGGSEIHSSQFNEVLLLIL